MHHCMNQVIVCKIDIDITYNLNEADVELRPTLKNLKNLSMVYDSN